MEIHVATHVHNQEMLKTMLKTIDILDYVMKFLTSSYIITLSYFIITQ